MPATANQPHCTWMNDSKVIVSCAGSGKTRKIIERLLALLGGGAHPGEILIITFTNKAAAEIRLRLLRALADGARDNPALAACRRRILLAAEPADTLTVHTFHSWFLLLLQNRPWTNVSGTPGVCADDRVLFDEAWRHWQRRAEQSPTAELQTVLSELSPPALYELCRNFKDKRNTWKLCKTPAAAASEDEMCALEKALQETAADFCQTAHGCGATFAKAQAAAARLAAAVSKAADEKAGFMNKDGTPLKVLQKNAEKHNYGLSLAAVTELLRQVLTADEARQAAVFNAAALAVCADFDREWEAIKVARNEITFDDLELRVCGMLEKNDIHSVLSHRLYVRYRHVLIDEFQDTSPLQWQIVRRWLHDSHGSDAQPSVFIVGDSKQAIYGFRHGDARLLGEAEKFLCDYYAAKPRPPENTCHRCAGNILTAVNAVFDGRMPAFSPHQTGPGNAALCGRVEWHPYAAASRHRTASRMRNPLIHPRPPADNVQEQRAAAVAGKVHDILQHWCIQDKTQRRRCRPEDVLILMPYLTHAAKQVEALAKRGIGCVASGRSISFLDSFECADILDLIAVLLAPGRDYSLARVLKSPIFAMHDNTLADIAGGEVDCLWDNLQQYAGADGRRARVLLKFWQRRARTTLLPAHDFLSRLFAQGGIVARYRAAVTPSLRRRTAENLSRLLDLSLLIEGGARPLLSQFLADARQHRSEQETPPSAIGGVRLMSIHAAKGLQAPVVILADAQFSQTGGSGNSADILSEWRPQQETPACFLVALRRHRLAHMRLREQAKNRREREQANNLYVAMTRAEQALVVFSPAKPAGVSQWLYQAMGDLTPGQKPETGLVFGDSLTAEGADVPLETPPPSGVREIIGKRKEWTAEMVRGEIRHRIMALLLSGVAVARARQLVAGEPQLWDEAVTMAASPPLQKLLHDSREVLIERDFAIDGDIIRPDLVIARAEAVWVVDYKTGKASPARHRQQLAAYSRAVAAHYPGQPIRLAVLDIHGQLHCLEGVPEI